MKQHDREELAEVNAARKGFYEFLASMYKLELTDEQIGTLAKQDLPTDAEYVGAGYATVKEYLRHRDSGTRQELAVDYARVFLCTGMYEQLMAPPYESVYTSEEHLLMQDARDSAVAFYLGEELGLPADNTTPDDHLSFEFQFMAKLIERAGAALDAGDEARYAEVYAAVMEALEEAPRKLDAIESLTDAMEITKSPRRFGQHFIDVLETCDCVIWGDGAWNLTDLGRAMLAELKSAKEA